jgi:hypothetical protein
LFDCHSLPFTYVHFVLLPTYTTFSPYSFSLFKQHYRTPTYIDPASQSTYPTLPKPRLIHPTAIHHLTGLYDTWVARDTCGTPLRTFWPYAKDPETVKLIRQEKVIPLAACWNGVVAVPAGDYLWRPEVGTGEGEEGGLRKRGWKMVDNCEFGVFLASIVFPSRAGLR